MGKTIFLLPVNNFDYKHFKRVKNIVLYRWKNAKILYFSLKESFDYYKKNYPELKVKLFDTKYITKEWLIEFEKKFGKIDRFIFMKNINEEFQPVEWDKKLNKNLNIYRDIFLGYEGLMLAGGGKVTRDHFPHLNKHIFVNHSTIGLKYFPYGYFVIHPAFGEINDFGFRLENDYTKYKYRKSNIKLIAIFGGSSAFGYLVPLRWTFGKILQRKLNYYCRKYKLPIKFVVLNFAQPTYLILNEIIAYILFAYDLKPDIVISHSGFNDFHDGCYNDTFIVKNYKFMYNHIAERFHNIIKGENTTDFVPYQRIRTNSSLVCNAYLFRKIQFEKLVEGNNGIFIGGLQPAFFSKFKLSDMEKQYIKRFIRIYDIPDIRIHRWKFIYDKYVEFEQKNYNFKHSLNFHKIFHKFSKNEILFGDHCHLFKKGEAVIAHEYFKYIIKKILRKYL